MSDPSSTAESTPEPDLCGRQLGDYHLLRRLGRGGMAEVYLAEQGSLRRQVALKVLRSNLAGDESYVRRFHKEAQAAASLVQANIVQIYGVDCIDGIHFIAQEYVAGKNLKQVLNKQGGFDAPLAVNIIRQVGAALLRADQQGITHRDIKPENIMLTATGEVKVADFGLARVTGNGEAVDVTQVGMTMGTPLYMSPEQIEGRPVDPRSDLYSLGITCYQMLAGQPPFEGETALSIAVQHLKTEADALSDARPDLPPGLCDIIHKLIAKQAGDRFQNAAEMLRELRALEIEADDAEWPTGLDQWASGELVSSPRVAATQQLDRIMRSQGESAPLSFRLWLVAAVAVVLAFSTGAVIAWINRPAALLEVDETEQPSFQRMGSAREQYFYASFVGTERALQSVWEYFPAKDDARNLYYIRLAKERLAEIYLGDNRLDRALQIYDELAAAESAEREFRARGMAGQAIVYDRQGEFDQARQKLAAVQAMLEEAGQTGDLVTREMREQIERLVKKYRDQGAQ